MDTFDQTLRAAAPSFFLLPGCEWVTYRPVLGSSRRIQAVVTRNEAAGPPGIGGGSGPSLEITVKNENVSGIASDQINTGGDQIEIAPRVGEPPRWVRIAEILDQDAGLMRLALL